MDFGSTGAMRSPFSPRVRQSITGRRPLGHTSATKNQNNFAQSPDDQSGDVVYKTPMMTIETYGPPLPVMVTEALTFASGEVSVRMSPCGWCWVVSGRRVVTWARGSLSNSASGSAPTSSVARELTLPQTDLAHKADLVVVYYEDGAQMPSCIGVSPEGTVRYWPSVGQEGVYVDVSCELAGQECERLSDYTSEGLVLATTTCTVVLLTPTIIDGRATVACRTLRPPSGWLGGIGRRVSLLFFGSMPAHADTKLVGVAVVGRGPQATIALVAGGPSLQLWRGAELHEHELRRALTEAHHREHGADASALEVVALDVRAAEPAALLLLIATVNVARSPDLRYAIARVDVSCAESPRVVSLCAVRGAPPAPAPAPPRFLPLARHALLYAPDYVALVPTAPAPAGAGEAGAAGEAQLVRLCAGERVLAGALCGERPLLFSAKHGVLALRLRTDGARPDSSACDSPMGSPCPSDMYDGNLSLYEIDPHEVSAVTRDACGKLKTAFLFHVRREAGACRALLGELCGRAGAEPDVDGVLDRTVLAVATDMLDDAPAGDPRWRARAGPATRLSLGSSAALQLAHQLRDKQRAFALFLDFLRATALWPRLGLLSAEGGGTVSTESALGGLAEQLAIAIALRQLQQGADAQLIDTAIYQVVAGAEEDEEPWLQAALAAGALSPSDVCWRRASRADRVLRELARAAPPADERAQPAHCAATIDIVTAALRAAHAERAHWPPRGPGEAGGPRPLLAALADLHKRALTQCVPKCGSAAQRAQLLDAAAALADLVLADAEQLARSPHTLGLYERLRRDIIRPYVEEGQVERAAALAEKFKDFELLIELCVRADDYERLFAYIDRFGEEGLAERAFAWLADGGGGGAGRAALVRRVGARCGPRLAGWLAAAGERAPLLALLRLQRGQHAPAAHLLAALAHRETRSLHRMTTAASLGKLCAVAGGEAEGGAGSLWAALGARLALAELQAGTPRALRLHHGLDAAAPAVLPPEDLVQMYIDGDGCSLTEYEYKKALDLTDFIEDAERRDDLRLKVWCASVVRDSWAGQGGQGADYAEGGLDRELREKTFFRLMELVLLMGGEGGEGEASVPAPEELLACAALAGLAADPRAHHLLKYGHQRLRAAAPAP